VPKSRAVVVGDTVTTQGWRSPDDEHRSIFPPGLSIGRVSNVATTETALEQQIQVTPFADLSSFHTVLVLDPHGRVR
jgi:cell shape-determining protein MreC